MATSGSSSETTPISSARQSVDINGMSAGAKNLFNVNHRYGRANSACKISFSLIVSFIIKL